MNITVEINALRIRAHHGVLEQERRVGNIFEVTLHMDYPLYDGTDNIDRTLNYAEAADIIKEQMAIPSQLLEYVAVRIRDAVMSRWPVITGGVIRVEKLTPPVSAQLKSAAVTLRW